MLRVDSPCLKFYFITLRVEVIFLFLNNLKGEKGENKQQTKIIISV